MIDYYIRVQNNLLKDYMKEKIIRLAWCEEDDNFYFTTTGYTAYKIPKSKFGIAIDRFTRFPHNPTSADFLVKMFADCNKEDYKSAISTGTYLSNGKNCTIIENENTKCYVDTKFLKEFPKDCTFKIKSELTAVFVLDGKFEVVLGVVMPMKVKK